MGDDKVKEQDSAVTHLTKPANAAAALKMAFGSKKVPLSVRVQKVLGNYRFLYYKYIDHFKKTPFDLDDLIDGLIYIYLMNQKD